MTNQELARIDGYTYYPEGCPERGSPHYHSLGGDCADPNYNDAGEMLRMLVREGKKKEYNVEWLYNGEVHFIVLRPYNLKERAVIEGEAPTFIEAAADAIQKVREA